MSAASSGRLLIVPSPLDFGCDEQIDLTEVIPLGTLRQAAALKNWVCENAKTTRAYLKRIDAVVPLACAIQSIKITELPRQVHKLGDHDGQFDARHFLEAALAGEDIGLVSEAGMPAVADPGSSVVRSAHALGLTVLPLVGPVSLLLALAASGLNGQNFAFHGYLPTDGAARAQRLKQLENDALQWGQTSLFIETPYRNLVTFQAAIDTLKPTTRLSISFGLTLSTGKSLTLTVSQWRQRPVPVDGRTPAIFGLGR